MKIRAVKREELSIVRELAHAIWPDTFKAILSNEQIQYMLNWMYNLNYLENQLDQGHHFYVAELESNPVGFIGIEPNHPEKGLTKIHKIYILPNQQGLGIGKKLIEFVKKSAIQSEMDGLLLNVNRFNKAVDFYKAIGFNIIFEENIDIGNGYLMEDYVMKLDLR
jgi:ribosomal protein S18 acetylase RimI-like enzyme